MKGKSIYIFSSLLIALLLISCGEKIRERRAFQDCKFGLDDVHIKQLGFDNIKVNLDIIVANPNSQRAVLDRLEFKIYGNDEHFADGVHEEMTEIPAYEKAFVYLSVSAKNKSVGKTLLSSMLSDSLTIRLEGTAYMDTFIGEIEYPVEMEREVH